MLNICREIKTYQGETGDVSSRPLNGPDRCVLGLFCLSRRWRWTVRTRCRGESSAHTQATQGGPYTQPSPTPDHIHSATPCWGILIRTTYNQIHFDDVGGTQGRKQHRVAHIHSNPQFLGPLYIVHSGMIPTTYYVKCLQGVRRENSAHATEDSPYYTQPHLN